MTRLKRIISKYEYLLVILYFITMTLIMTWPLVTKISRYMVGSIGDNIYFVWMIGWFKQALFELHINPFNIWFLNYPEGWNLAYTEITPGMLLLAIPFTFISTPTFGYNAAMLLSFVLSGLGMYLWIKSMTGRRDAALIAGTIFAFLPYKMAHFLVGHLNLSGTQWFPFFFWGIWELFFSKNQEEESPRKFNWKAVLIAGISAGLIAWSSMYYIYMTAIITVFMFVIYLVFMKRKQFKNWLFWKQLILLGLVALPLVLAAAYPYIILSKAGGLPNRDLEVVRRYSASASPTDFILPSTDHFLFGSWVGAHFNRELWGEATLYIGLAAGILGLLALIKARKTGHKQWLWLMVFGGLLAVILAFGPDLRWQNEMVVFTLPQFLANLLGRARIHVPLPGYFMFKYFPFFSKLRAFARFGIFTLTFTSAAAGIGAAYFLSKVKKNWQTFAAVLLLALAVFDFYPGPFPVLSEVEARPVDYWLAEQPGEGALIQFPFWMGEDQNQIYNTLIHQKPYVGGFFNAFPPRQYQVVYPVMENFPDEESIGMFPGLGVQYVLVDVDEYEDADWVRGECERLGLVFIQQMDDQMIFEYRGSHD